MTSLPATRLGPAPLIRRVGENGLLLEFDGIVAVHRIAAWLDDHPLRGALDEVVPAARTVFVTGAPIALERIAADVGRADPPDHPARSPRTHVVPMRYDGVDLRGVADRTGMTVSQIVSLHAEAVYTVDFFGFAPGHAYLSGVPAALRVPRRPSPRTRVPAGAVAIANEYTAIYPTVSPGGWNLIGTNTGQGLWNSRASPPNRVNIGDHIVFRTST
jgi:KipI family sensor histidine kinase inhibitor